MTPMRLADNIRYNAIAGAVALVLAQPITAQHDKLFLKINRLWKPTKDLES